MDRIADGLRRRFDFDTSQIGDDLPDFFIGHSHALAISSVGRHRGPGDSVADVLEQVRVGTAVALLRMSKIWAASATASTKTVAEGTVDAEFEFARLGCFGISCERIAICRWHVNGRQQHKQHGEL